MIQNERSSWSPSFDRILPKKNINSTLRGCHHSVDPTAATKFQNLSCKLALPTSGAATGVARGGRVPPMTAKVCQKSGKREKIRKKEEKLGRKVKNWEVSFTLPLLTDKAGYATAPYQHPNSQKHNFHQAAEPRIKPVTLGLKDQHQQANE